MTLATAIFGTETRLRPLVKTLLAVTALRVSWIAINVWHPDALSLGWALVPWPWRMLSLIVWGADIALVFYQLRAGIRLGRMLLLRYAPRPAAFLGFSAQNAGDTQHLRPRNRSWLPTALQLSAILVLSCCVLSWLAVMVWFRQWGPFDFFMWSPYADRPLQVGLALSVLGLMFGGKYIVSASRQVRSSFGVTLVEDSHWLAERVHGLAEKLNLPKPAVGITNVVNAFAMGARQKSSMVVIGQPLFALERDELDAIIGHELGHILHKDIARMQFAEGFQRMLVGVVNILTVVGMIFAVSASKKRADARLNAHLAWGTGVVVRKTVFIASELVTKGISRNREFHADAVGAHVTSADAMARSLKRIHEMPDKPTAQEHHYGYLMFRGMDFGNLFSTHPTLQARLKALDAHAIAESIADPTGGQPPATGAYPAQGVGLAEPARAAKPSLWAKLRMSARARWARRRSSALRARVTTRRLLVLGAACVALAVVAPAIINFYALDRRFDDTRVSAGHALSSSWGWVIATKEAWFGDDELKARDKQLGEREQALKIAEARLDTDRATLAKEKARIQAAAAANVPVPARPAPSGSGADAMRAQVGELTTQVKDLVSQRDDLRNTILDLRRRLVQQTGQAPDRTNEMLLQLDAANADRTRLMAQLAALQKPTSQPALPAQTTSLSDQLSKMTADRDEMTHRNDVLRDMNLELKGQIATRDMARAGLDKQIQDLQNQIVNLTTNPSENPAQIELPTVRPPPPGRQGGYGAFAVAGNGTIILTDRSFGSEQEASDAALAECGQFSGGSQCAVRQTFRNTCAAVARVAPVSRKSRYALQLEPTIQDAEEMALSECYQRNGRPCEVTRQVCVR
ncbi:hypothetical protein C7I87_20980 [Mesorhizobium sp. SARCC-RB16n]|uniref:M48 family metalloprotease n=1 Tax=Mesorhizobium sp. SARCC-RB16n TaxID=2116687 RepID=UPI00122FACD5|nr:M48 family metalloprotease [Mesorhizobium sp. SARCC-RB16n]KAA3448627.1 hypothetical protein C7I87_20980 [Mesorhizobium sp. SARCC-RB16n]